MSSISPVEETPALSESEVRIAQESVREILPRLKEAKSPFIRLEENGERIDVPLPPSVLPLIAEILSQMAKGHQVAVHSPEDEMTTQEAAEFLGVSHSFLTGLLDRGEVEFYRVGNQRRLKKSAVWLYERRRRERGEAALREMAALDQEMGLYE
jgi:excisionase family DNA binding protein